MPHLRRLILALRFMPSRNAIPLFETIGGRAASMGCARCIDRAIPDCEQVHRQEHAPSKSVPRKRRAGAGPDAGSQVSTLPEPPQEFPPWIKNARLRRGQDASAAQKAPEEPTQAAPGTGKAPLSAPPVTSTPQTAVNDERSKTVEDALDAEGLVLPVATCSGTEKTRRPRAQRSRDLVERARQQGRESEKNTPASIATRSSESAFPEAVAFLQSERDRVAAGEAGAADGVIGAWQDGSAAAAAVAFLESERRISKVERAKAMTKALLTKKKPPKVPTLQPGMHPPKSRQTSLARQLAVQSVIASTQSREGESGAPRDSAADLRVALPALAQDKVELPLRYRRLMQQYDCLDTALSFLKTRRQTGICFAQLRMKGGAATSEKCVCVCVCVRARSCWQLLQAFSAVLMR